MFIFDSAVLTVLVGACVFFFIATSVSRAWDSMHGRTTLSRAMRIIGRDYFSPKDIVEHLRVPLSKKALKDANRIPWTEKTIRERAEEGGWSLVAVTWHSLNAIREMDLRRRVARDNWSAEHLFANKEGARSIEWHFVRMAAVPHSGYLSYAEQRQLLTSRERVPSARVMMYAMRVLNEKHGCDAFLDRQVRCADRDNGGNCIQIGLNRSYDVVLGRGSGHFILPTLFLASELIPDGDGG